MRMSDMVARYIMDILDEHNGAAEIKRNELATTLGCVPSQINYVITSRFTRSCTSSTQSARRSTRRQPR